MWFLWLWFGSIVATLLVADHKGLSRLGYFFLALFTGPLALIVVLLSSSRTKEADELASLRSQLGNLQKTVTLLEAKVALLEEKSSATPAGQTVMDQFSAEMGESRPEGAAIPLSASEALRDFDREALRASLSKEEFTPVPAAKPRDVELDFGRNWLSKIGVVVLALGVGFLISYTFKYFGPVLKIAFGYAAGAGLFVAGLRLEKKERFVHFGRVLLGGGWALVYFTTYAMHHFDASRLIDSQILDAVLLALVVAGMIWHVSRYRSESMMSLALFVAYLTSTMGRVTGFTVFSCLLLGVLAVFLIYRFQWVWTFLVAVIMTYAVHFVWVAPNIAMTLGMSKGPLPGPGPQDALNLVFLGLYWLVFLAGVHLVRVVNDEEQERILAVTNFGNVLLCGVLAYPLILLLFYDQRSVWVLGTGIIYFILALRMKARGCRKLYLSDMVAAVLALTCAIALRFLPSTSLLLWLVEIPCLLYCGVTFREKVFRYLGYGLTIFVAFRMFLMEAFSEDLGRLMLGGWVMSWTDLLFFWAGISAAVSFVLLYRARRDLSANPLDNGFEYGLSALACYDFAVFVGSQVSLQWLVFALAVEALALFLVSVTFQLGRFRVYSYLLLFWLMGVFIGNPLDSSSLTLKGFITLSDVAVFFLIYVVLKRFKKAGRLEELVDNEAVFPFGAGIVMLILAIFMHVQPQWISLCLGISSAVLILLGIAGGDKTERLGGLGLLALTLGRVIFVDLSGLDIIFKIITFIALGLLFLGASYFYNRFSAGDRG